MWIVPLRKLLRVIVGRAWRSPFLGVGCALGPFSVSWIHGEFVWWLTSSNSGSIMPSFRTSSFVLYWFIVNEVELLPRWLESLIQ